MRVAKGNGIFHLGTDQTCVIILAGAEKKKLVNGGAIRLRGEKEGGTKKTKRFGDELRKKDLPNLEGKKDKGRNQVGHTMLPELDQEPPRRPKKAERRNRDTARGKNGVKSPATFLKGFTQVRLALKPKS